VVRRYELSYWADSAKKIFKKDLKDTAKKRIKTKNIKGVMLWATDVRSRTAFAQPGPVSSISLGRLFSVRVSETDPRPGTWLRSGRLICSARTVTTPLDPFEPYAIVICCHSPISQLLQNLVTTATNNNKTMFIVQSPRHIRWESLPCSMNAEQHQATCATSPPVYAAIRWRHAVVVNALVAINEVTLRRAQLVLG